MLIADCRLMFADDVLEASTKLAVKDPDSMPSVLQTSVAALVNVQSLEVVDAGFKQRAVRGNKPVLESHVASLNGLSPAGGDRQIGEPNHGHLFSTGSNGLRFLSSVSADSEYSAPESADRTGFQQCWIWPQNANG